MPENDLYPQKRGTSKKPVTILLTVLLIVGFAAFAYVTADHWQSGTKTTPVAAPGTPNPNVLVPPGSGSQSPTPP